MPKPPPPRLPQLDLVDDLLSNLPNVDMPESYKLILEFVLLALHASKDLTSWGTIGLDPTRAKYQLGYRSADHPRYAIFRTEEELQEELDYALSTARRAYKPL